MMNQHITRIATNVTNWAGSTTAVALAAGSIGMFLVVGIFFSYSEGYQMVANTWMSAISYLMLFILQHAQARDTKALHMKIDELIMKVGPADNRLMAAEHLSDEELEALACRYQAEAERPARISSDVILSSGGDPTTPSSSIERK